MIRRLSLVAALLAVAPVAQARDITGEIAYRERIALAQDAQVLVELRGPTGTVAEARIETGGRQVPLPFTLVAPDTGTYSLQGAIFVAGRLVWLSDVVTVPEGEGLVDLGMVALARPVGMGFSSAMACGAVPVDVTVTGATAHLRTGGADLTLQQVDAASGAKYSDGATPETVFWSKGNSAMVTLKGVELAECQPVIGPPLLPLSARGNEPGWRLDLSMTGYVYEGDFGAARAEGPPPEPMPVGSKARFDLSDRLSVMVDRTLCRDSMTGMPHPVTVTLTDGDRVLPGCGGAPVDLLAGGWSVDHIDGAVLPDAAEVTLAFDAAAGRVFGKSACNRYNGSFKLTGEGLSFGPAAVTMMACPEDLMAVEQAFLRGLTTIDRFDLTPDGRLELYSGSTAVLRAHR